MGGDTDTDSDPAPGPLVSDEHLGPPEVCNGKDDDGDGEIDEGVLMMPAWHYDADFDGYGGREVIYACERPYAGWVSNGDDCDDASALAYPGAPNDGICDDGVGDCAGDVGCRYVGGHFSERARADWAYPTGTYILGLAAAGDQDGDGRDDLIAGRAWAGTAEADFARVVHWSERHDQTLDGPRVVTVSRDATAAGIGNQMSYSGDVTGDGRADVLVLASSLASESRGVTMYWLADHLGDSSTITEAGPRLYPGFPTDTSAGPGDVDGDGLGDLLVAEGMSGSGDGRAALYLGQRGGVASEPRAVLDGEDNVLGVAGLGDTDGDGLSDFAVSQENSSKADYIAGMVYVYTAAPSGDVTLGDGSVSLWGGYAERAGTSVAGAGDVDGDGYDDMVVGSVMAAEEAYGYDNTVAAHLVLGPISEGALADVSAMTIETPDHVQALGITTVQGLGDLDGDGFGDFGVSGDVLHYHEGDGWLGGAVEVFYGPGPRGVVDFDAADAWLYGDGVGGVVANVGDFDGDGGPDVAFARDNHLWLFLGQQP